MRDRLELPMKTNRSKHRAHNKGPVHGKQDVVLRQQPYEGASLRAVYPSLIRQIKALVVEVWHSVTSYSRTAPGRRNRLQRGGARESNEEAEERRG